MARKARVEFAGALYHALDRGDRQEAIFRDAVDQTRFLATLGEACARTGWRVHAFVLMTNHYHFMVETPQPNLVAGMRWFQTTYTVRFNRRHRLSGHLFQGRYKSVVVGAPAEERWAQTGDRPPHPAPDGGGQPVDRGASGSGTSQRGQPRPATGRPESSG